MSQFDFSSKFQPKGLPAMPPKSVSVIGTKEVPIMMPAEESPHAAVLSEQIRRETARIRETIKREQGWLV